MGLGSRYLWAGKPAGGLALCPLSGPELEPVSGPGHFVLLKFLGPEILTSKSNFNNLINYIICFISWSE